MAGQASVNTIKEREKMIQENENKERGKTTFLKEKTLPEKVIIHNTTFGKSRLVARTKDQMGIKGVGPEKTTQRHQQP